MRWGSRLQLFQTTCFLWRLALESETPLNTPVLGCSPGSALSLFLAIMTSASHGACSTMQIPWILANKHCPVSPLFLQTPVHAATPVSDVLALLLCWNSTCLRRASFNIHLLTCLPKMSTIPVLAWLHPKYLDSVCGISAFMWATWTLNKYSSTHNMEQWQRSKPDIASTAQEGGWLWIKIPLKWMCDVCGMKSWEVYQAMRVNDKGICMHLKMRKGPHNKVSIFC